MVETWHTTPYLPSSVNFLGLQIAYKARKFPFHMKLVFNPSFYNKQMETYANLRRLGPSRQLQ